MKYLFFEVWILLLLAFILGWLTHWYWCRRNKNGVEVGSENTVVSGGNATAASTTVKISDSWKPLGFTDKPEHVDDLKRIKGIGPVIEETLNGLGVYQFNQVANWNPDNIAWVESLIAFPGRITREHWITQAGTLEGGGSTDFADRVDSGKVDYR